MWNVFERRRLDILPKIPIAPIATEETGTAKGMHLAAAEFK
jgi:hypothetical protein